MRTAGLSSSSGGALLVLSAILVDALDAAWRDARRVRCSWLLVYPGGVDGSASAG